MSQSTFDIAQALRRSHCDRQDSAHECVGEVTIKRGEVCLSCPLCGKGEEIPGWSFQVAERCRAIFDAAGVKWDALDFEAKRRAVGMLSTMEKL